MQFINLSLLVERKKIDEIINNGNNLKDKVNQIFCNYIKSMNKTVLDSINLYFYYLGFFIQSINSFKLLLYYFLKTHKRLQIFEYKDYCPDLDNSNCLNLIILFYKNINNKPIETLFVYAFLIFNYKKVCDDLEDNIEPSILEKSINQTSELVKRKTLDIKPMDEEEAILQMELLGHDFFVFKNIDEECISVLYKRKDGAYGIINTK